MDGLACSIIYIDGVYKQAITRGDGRVGEDVTTNVRTIVDVPRNLKETKESALFLHGRTEIRGEIIMLKQDFDKLNKQQQAQGKPVFANPRNLAAGTIRQLDPKLVAKRPLHFRAYDLIRDDPTETPTNSFTYKTLISLGVVANPDAPVFNNLNQVMGFIDEWEQRRESLPFKTDGLVIKLNDRKVYRDLGVVGKNPRAAVAYKYAPEEATTIVKDIVISLGRTGAATPVAVFDPVVVAGTTVQHASLHNADEIARKDIRVGDTVVIFKAGDIIPQVLSVITKLRPKNSKPFNMEDELTRQYPELKFVRGESEAIFRIKNMTGGLLLKAALEHFASKGALDIDTLGEKNVAALVDGGLVKDLADIYALSKDQVLSLDRFAEVSSNNLIEAIAAKKHPELRRFIYGLGIRHVGAQTAVDLAEHFKNMENLSTATFDSLLSIEGIGEIVAESILGWFATLDNEKLLNKFTKLNVIPHFESTAEGALAGKSFVITGSLQTMGRDQAAERIRSLGGVFQTSVSKETDYLVVAGKVGKSKLTKAEQFGTAQITEEQLLSLLDKS
jgi:DNA ligase (NAD+)